jgi:hypothetical protein
VSHATGAHAWTGDHDKIGAWTEWVSATQFRFCIREFNNDNSHDDHAQVQYVGWTTDYLGSAIASSITTPTKGAGRQCDTVTFPEPFDAVPTVVASIDHSNRGVPHTQTHNAIFHWVEGITATEFKVCTEEGNAFDGMHHVAVNINYIATPQNEVSAYFGASGRGSYIGGATRPFTGKTCQRIPFGENFSRKPVSTTNPLTLPSHQPISPQNVMLSLNHLDQSSTTVNAAKDGIVTWAEDITQVDFRVCAEEIDSYDSVHYEVSAWECTQGAGIIGMHMDFLRPLWGVHKECAFSQVPVWQHDWRSPCRGRPEMSTSAPAPGPASAPAPAPAPAPTPAPAPAPALIELTISCVRLHCFGLLCFASVRHDLQDTNVDWVAFHDTSPTASPTAYPTAYPTAAPTAAPTFGAYHLMLGRSSYGVDSVGDKPNGVCSIDTRTTGDHTNSHGDEIGVTCCNALTGTGASRPGCKKNYNFADAEQHCADNGQVLCSTDQIAAGAGSRTGCSFDAYHVWTRDGC